ncbi:alpha/beta hydrolase [Duganella radicis]|nr:alpha/beta hydrolase [Duganella radicis]
MTRKVRFKSDNLTLVGNLFTPENFDESGNYKAVVVAGSFTSVKEQMAGTYGQKLAENGFVALAIDYSHYGESEGQPRQYESPAEKLRDLKAAVTYLSSLPYVQGVGMVGVCTSAGNAAYLAADDARVKALATVAAFLPGPALINRVFGEAEIARRRAAGAAAKLTYEQTGEQILVPAYSNADQFAVNYNPAATYDYYFNEARGGVPQWRNEFAVMSYGPWLDFSPLDKAPAIKIPTLVVHSDGAAFPEQAKEFYTLLGGVKELAWGDGTHFDYYDQATQADFAIQSIAGFFRKQLS